MNQQQPLPADSTARTIQCPGCRSSMILPNELRNSAAVACPTCGATIPLVNPAVALPQANAYAANAFPNSAMMPPPMPVQVHPQTVGMAMQPRPNLSGQSTWIVAGALGIAAIAVITAVAAMMRPQGGRPPVSPIEFTQPGSSITSDDNKRLRIEAEKLNSKIEKQQTDINRLEKEKARLEQENATLKDKVVFTDKLRPASFIVLNQSSSATAIQDGPDGFRVLDKMQPPWVEYAHRVANKYQIPRLDRDPTLATQIYNQAKVGELLSEALATPLKKFHWHTRPYVPYRPDENPMFVSFYDVREKRTRIGFFSKVGKSSNNEPELEFWPVGNQMVQLSPGRIDPPTAFKATPAELKLEPETDFLDLCALRIAQMLGPTDNSPRLTNLSINVSVDWLDELLKQSKTPDLTWVDRYFDFIARARNEPYRPSARKAEARELRVVAAALHDELFARLRSLDVPVLEREKKDTVLDERALAKRPEFEQMEYAKALCATHIVVAELGKPTDDGKWRLSVRLNEVGTMRNIWADHCDIQRRLPPLVGSIFLNSGRPAQVQMAKSGPPKLGYLEQDSMRKLMLRSLFGIDWEPVPSDNPKIEDLDIYKVSRPQRMECLMWELVRQIMPRGGRVTQIEGDSAHVSLGRDDAFQTGTRCRVWRMDSQNSRLLPIQLSANDISDTKATVSIFETGLEQLWPPSIGKLAINDVVVRKDVAPSYVAVVPPVLDLTIIDPKELNDLRILERTKYANFQAILRACQGASEQLWPKIEQRLARYRVNIAESHDTAEFKAIVLNYDQILILARNKRLTHVIRGAYAPTRPPPTNNETFPVTFRLELIDVAAGEKIASFPKVELLTSDIANFQ